MNPSHSVALPRVGLLGNPSDGYGGRVLSFTFDAFRARAVVEPDAEEACVRLLGKRIFGAPDVHALRKELRPRERSGGPALLAAALQKLWDHSEAAGAGLVAVEPDDPRTRFHLTFTCDIPQQVGLSGSSAIIIAVLRALGEWFSLPIASAVLAELALLAETEVLGITAGPQDRVIQAFEGFMDMDFKAPVTASSFERLDSQLLPDVFIAWDPKAGDCSGIVHNQIRSRFGRGDTSVVQAMGVFADLAREGRRCLERRDVEGLRRCVNENFDTRAGIWNLSDRDVTLVRTGRSLGAAVKFCGSGGSVLGIPQAPEDLPRIEARYQEAGFAFLRPTVARENASA